MASTAPSVPSGRGSSMLFSAVLDAQAREQALEDELAEARRHVCQLQAELNAARGELGETKLALATELQRNADFLSLLTSGSTGISASQEATAIAAASAVSYLT